MSVRQQGVPITPKVDCSKIAATSEEDIARHMREDGEDPGAAPRTFVEDVPPAQIREHMGMTQVEFAETVTDGEMVTSDLELPISRSSQFAPMTIGLLELLQAAETSPGTRASKIKPKVNDANLPIEESERVINNDLSLIRRLIHHTAAAVI